MKSYCTMFSWTLFCGVCFLLFLQDAVCVTSQCLDQPLDVLIARDQSLILDCLHPASCHNISKDDVNSRSVTWAKDGKVISFSNIFGRKTLLENGSLWIAEPINRPGISDSGLYSCKVKHKSTWVQSRIASVTIAVLGPFSVQPLSTSIMVGESHRFICKIPNAIPTPVTTWFKNNILLGNNSFVSAEVLSRRFSSVIILPNGELEVKNASERDMGNYHCSVSNIAKSRRSSKAMLIILPNTTQEQSLPKLLRRPVNTSTVVGMSVYFDCFADGFPNPKITWLKGGKNLNFSNNIFQIGQGGLVIKHATISDSGQYTCGASNVIGRVNTTAVLDVADTPNLKEFNYSPILAFENQTILVPCNISNSPGKRIIWLADGLTLQNASAIENQDGSIQFKVNQPTTLQCFVKTMSGIVQNRRVIAILPTDTIHQSFFETSGINTPQGIIQGPSHLAVRDSPPGCANLTWSYHNENGGIRFKVFVFDAKLTNIEVLDTASSSVVFNVSESHLIKVKVIPYNNAGTGNSSEVLSFISPISRNLNLTVQTCAACEIKNLKMQAVSSTEIKASWDPCSLHHNLCNYRLDVMGPSSQHKTITTRNTTVVVDRLDKYAVYEIKVGTLNGQFSTPVSTRTAESVPDLAPQNITVISETSNTAIVRWTPLPQSHINGRLFGYKIRLRNKDSRETQFLDVPPDKTQFLLTGLTRNTEYSLRMQASTNMGGGPPSQRYFFETPKRDRPESTPPGKPLFLTTQRFSTEIIISWRPPAENVYIRFYVIDWGRRAPHEKSHTVDNKVRIYRITGLDPSTQYFISVRAGNRIGRGVKSLIKVRTKAAEDDIEDPYPPLALNIDVLTPTTINVSWHDSHAKSSNYYIIRYKTNVPSEPRVRILNSTTTYCLIHALRPYTMYEVAVKTVRGRKRSSWSMIESATTKQSKPGSPPTDLTVMDLEDLTSVQLNWQPPEEPNGELNGYLIFYTTDPHHNFANWVFEPVVGDKLSTVIKGLTLDTQYYIKALARNPMGVGPYSDIIEYKTKSAPKLKQESTWIMPTWMLYMIIGGVALLVISVVVIATLVVCRNRAVDRSKYKKRKSNTGRPPSVRNHDSDSWSRSNGSNIITAAPLLHHDDRIELQSLRMGEQCKCDYTRSLPSSEILALNGMSCNHMRDRGNRPNQHYLFQPNGRGTPQSPKYQTDCTLSYPDCTGDSAYSSDHPVVHYSDDVYTNRSKRGQNKFRSDVDDVRRGNPQTEYGNHRNSVSNSLISDETNSELADVEDFVRGMKSSCSSELT